MQSWTTLNTAANTSTNHSSPAAWKAWLIVLVASSLFFYEFIQMNMFDSISVSLMHAFHVDAAKLGYLSSFYFIANVVFLFVAGTLLDRCATRKVILGALAICILGTILFSFATSFAWACFFRFLTGIGSAFCFLSVIRLASRWFPPHRMAFVTGVILMIAMIGGYISQTPMTLLVHAMHWRTALQVDSAVGLIFLLLIYLIVKDYPEGRETTHLAEQKAVAQIGYMKSLRMAYLRVQNWLAGAYVFLMNLPVGLLGGLWGTLYVMHTYDLSKVHASEISSMLFMGPIAGSPIAGWISDKMKMRRPVMMGGAIISLGLIALVIYVHRLSFYELMAVFFLIGAVTSTQVIGYPFVAENSKRIITAMSVSVVNISVQGGTGLFQPFFGYLMDKHMLMRTHHLSTHFTASDFHWAMWIFPIGFVLAIFTVLGMRETHCKQREESKAGAPELTCDPQFA